jgi:hypothetical protein
MAQAEGLCYKRTRGMTRRQFISMAAGASVLSGAEAPLIVPVHRVMDSRTQGPPEMLQRFWWSIWPEAVRDFQRCGIQLQTTDATGEVRRSPSDMPIFIGLRRGVINLVLTDHIPMSWDHGRALGGVALLYAGYHVCMIALRYAHGNQIPFLSVNVCVHELLHVLLQDIYIKRPKWYVESEHELRIDSAATRLWLFHDGAGIRKATQEYLARLR